MRNWRWAVLSTLMIASALPCLAAHPSVDTGECEPETPKSDTELKSPVFVDTVRGFRSYGTIAFHLVSTTESDVHCHVIYRLFVAEKGKQFHEVMQFAWDTETGEIAGIDLVGLSKDGNKFAADFWWVAGDGWVHRPVVYSMATGRTTQAALEDKIQKRIHGCDQNEYFVGVTNAGEAVFSIPPSTYDDGPECGDKGLWHFNLKTGKVYRVKKFSGVKWE